MTSLGNMPSFISLRSCYKQTGIFILCTTKGAYPHVKVCYANSGIKSLFFPRISPSLPFLLHKPIWPGHSL